MVDIQVKNLTKFFVIGENLLDGLSFEIQEGECVAILGRNGCGKTTLFNILTGQMDYDDGEVYVNPNKKMGLISQIPNSLKDLPWKMFCGLPMLTFFASVRRWSFWSAKWPMVPPMTSCGNMTV